MTPEHWQQIDQLFHEALALEPANRADFLAGACDDEEMRLEVESLIASHEEGQSFIEHPAGDVAAELLSQSPDAQSVLGAGQRLLQYEVIEPLGKGGMGQVYLAVDTRLRRKVALKLLPPSNTNDFDRVRRFEQEAQAASALNHPNIVTIHEIGQTDSLNFIATEFIDGKTLREYLKKDRMSLIQLLEIALQAAAALQAAHEAGIIHRDIKPENLMLRRDGIIKVLDFGLAKLGSQDLPALQPLTTTPSTVNTNAGVVMGTVGYMSPEQARGEEVDERSDIWSLGVVLYEIVAGRAPFAGVTASHLIASMLESQPPPLSKDLGVPAELERIIKKALNKKKAQRYQSANDLAVDLRNLKEELEIEARLKRNATFNTTGVATPRNTFTETGLNQTADTVSRESPRQKTLIDSLTGTSRRRLVIFAVLILSVATVIGWMYFAKGPVTPNLAAGGKRSIAVLPLKPIKAGDGDYVYQIGIADSLIHRLGSANGFTVKSLDTIRRYAEMETDPITVGKEQKVDYVLVSNYQLAAGRISVTAQLFDVATGQMAGTYKTDQDSSNLFAMQDAVALEIGNRLLAQFATTSSVQTSKRGTTNESAYRLYLQGMYLANMRNRGDAVKAIEALEQAVALDPNYARAWAGLAYAHRTLSNYRPYVSTRETYQKSIAAINKALALDQNLSEAHSALCENKYLFEWDFAGAEVECKLAIQLDPNSSQAREIYTRYLMGRGRHEEAITEIKTAIDLEPTSKFNQHMFGRVLFCARRFSEAEEQFKRVLAMDQNYLSAYSWLTSTLALQGNEVEANEWFKKLLAVRKVSDATSLTFQRAFEQSGWRGVLQEWVKRFDELSGTNFDGALYHAQLGNKDEAFRFLEIVYQRREIWNAYLRVDPRLDPLRDDPRFVDLLKRVEGNQ